MKNSGIFCILYVLASICLSLLISTQGWANDFHVGYFLVKPHAMPGQQADPEGIAVRYFKQIAVRMKLSNIHYSLFPLKRLLVELEQNRIQMALLLAKSPERAAMFVYPGSPFCLTKPSIAVRVSHPLKNVNMVEDKLQ